jgi:hypothetical protein
MPSKSQKKKTNVPARWALRNQAVEQMMIQEKRMDPREFRDAMTRAKGAIVSIPTGAANWNRWKV